MVGGSSITVPSAFRIWTLWKVPDPSSFLKSIPNGWFAATTRACLSNAMFKAVRLSVGAFDGRLTAGPGLALELAVALQQSGTGDADGAGLEFGSSQPRNVSTVPLASRIGS